jgi:hypothetical protein
VSLRRRASPLSASGALPHDSRMTRRTTAAAVAAALLVAAAALHPGCAPQGGGSPVQPGGVLAAASPSSPGTAQKGSEAAAPSAVRPAAAETAPVSGSERLDAVRTVKLFCDLVGSRRRGQARELLGAPGVLEARELRGVRGFAFVSARVTLHRRADTLTVAANVRVGQVRGGPLRAGVDTLFFTLGRVGTTAGGWLITAVTTSP